MAGINNKWMIIIKWFAVIMIVLTVSLIIIRLAAVTILDREVSGLYEILFDIFALSTQILLYKTSTQTKPYSRWLKYIWPLIVIIGLSGLGYIVSSIFVYNLYEPNYKSITVLLYYPPAYSILIIIIGAFIGLAMRLKFNSVKVTENIT